MPPSLGLRARSPSPAAEVSVRDGSSEGSANHQDVHAPISRRQNDVLHHESAFGRQQPLMSAQVVYRVSRPRRILPSDFEAIRPLISTWRACWVSKLAKLLKIFHVLLNVSLGVLIAAWWGLAVLGTVDMRKTASLFDVARSTLHFVDMSNATGGDR